MVVDVKLQHQTINKHPPTLSFATVTNRDCTLCNPYGSTESPENETSRENGLTVNEF